MGDLISVVVPVHNVEPYLERSIGSILDQTHTNLEVIAVDDGSTDGSLLVLKSLSARDRRIRVLHQDNAGVTAARLAGVREAKGAWIGFVDADDEIEAGMYERLLANAHSYEADISHCGYQMVFPSRVDYYYNTGQRFSRDTQRGMRDLLEGKFVEPGVWNKLYSRWLCLRLLETGVMDPSIRNFEDLLMNYYLFSWARVSVYEDFCPYHYILRKNSAATSSVSETKLKDPLCVLQIIAAGVAGDDGLRRVANARIAGILIGQATMYGSNRKVDLRFYRKQARQRLLSMLPELLKGKYSIRIKLLSTWAAVWPLSYSVMHGLYAKMRGTDRKYEVQ